MMIEEKKLDYPFVGYYKGGKIEVDERLTAPEKAFVVAHEYTHSKQKKSLWWVWRELQATIYPLLGCVMLMVRFVPRSVAYIRRKGRR